MVPVRRRWLAVLVLAAACTAGSRGPRPADMSGFLDDYSRLRPGPAEGATFVYRDPEAKWAAYDRVLLDPVTVWRSGKNSLSDIPEADLQRLAAELEKAVRAHLGPDYRLVSEPGAGVLRVRLGITDARQSDRVLDVFTFEVPPTHAASDAQELLPATHAFVVAAAIEGELTDSATNRILAQAVDRRGERRFATWGDVRVGVERWATWFAGRLRRGRSEGQ